MDEDSSLVNPAFKRSKTTLILWWILNVSIVLFVFLAFVMSTAAYVHSKEVASNINNNYIGNGALIENKYKVAHAYTIKKGSIVSFCDEKNEELCEGLGPVWGRPFGVQGVYASWTPAILNSVAQLTNMVSIYVHVVESDHTTIRASFVDTHWMAVNGTALLQPGAPGTPSPISSLHARAIDAFNAVVMFTTHNETYMQVLTVTATGGIQWAPNAVNLFAIHDPAQNGTLVRNVAVAGNWVIVSYAYHDQTVKYEVFLHDQSNPTRLRQITSFPVPWTFSLHVRNTIATHYLGNGYILQASASVIALGKIDFNQNTISMIKSVNFEVDFYAVQITQLEGDLVLLTGTQIAFVDEPLTLAMMVQWYNTTNHPNPLIVHWPTNLLATHEHMPVGDQLSVCYHPPTDHEPHGGIFFSYVDALSRRAKIARARPVWTNQNAHVLPSPSLDISTHQYGKYHSWLAPHLTCAVSQNLGQILIAVQDFNTVFNNFYWSGGLRYAGIAQENGPTGSTLNVVRNGISASTALIPGFTYYAWNNGSVAPFTSTHELFTPNGFPFPVGTAITETKLHLATDAFDRFN